MLSRSPAAQASVLVMRKAVKDGDALQADSLKIRQQVPAHPLQVQARYRRMVLGRRTRNPLAVGQPLLWSDLAVPESVAHPLAARLPAGKQAVNIAFVARDRMGGSVAPGDQVELWWQGVGGLRSLGTRLEILALDGRYQPVATASAPRTATFAVPVSSVSPLLALQRRGQFLFSVISLADHGEPVWHLSSLMRSHRKKRIRTPVAVVPRLYTGQ